MRVRKSESGGSKGIQSAVGKIEKLRCLSLIDLLLQFVAIGIENVIQVLKCQHKYFDSVQCTYHRCAKFNGRQNCVLIKCVLKSPVEIAYFLCIFQSDFQNLCQIRSYFDYFIKGIQFSSTLTGLEKDKIIKLFLSALIMACKGTMLLHLSGL